MRDGPSPRREGRLRRIWGRLVRSNDELVADELARAVTATGAQTIAGVHVRDRVVLQGDISSVTIGPRDGGPPRLEASLTDGTGSVALVWMGRRTIAGLEVGRRILVRGTLTVHGGRQVIFNPYYELLT